MGHRLQRTRVILVWHKTQCCYRTDCCNSKHSSIHFLLWVEQGLIQFFLIKVESNASLNNNNQNLTYFYFFNFEQKSSQFIRKNNKDKILPKEQMQDIFFMQNFFSKKKKQEKGKQSSQGHSPDSKQAGCFAQNFPKIWSRGQQEQNEEKLRNLASSYTQYSKHSKKKEFEILQQFKNLDKVAESSDRTNSEEVKDIYQQITLDILNMHYQNQLKGRQSLQSKKSKRNSNAQEKQQQFQQNKDLTDQNIPKELFRERSRDILKEVLMKRSNFGVNHPSKERQKNRDRDEKKLSPFHENSTSFMRYSSQNSNSNSRNSIYRNFANNSNPQKQKWLKVDKKVTIVNGKLVYSKAKMPIIQTQAQLISFLQKNGIKLKDYIYGNKEQILQTILENYERKQKQEIEKYINKNMKEQEAVEVKKTAWYEHAKGYLFDD